MQHCNGGGGGGEAALVHASARKFFAGRSVRPSVSHLGSAAWTATSQIIVNYMG